MRIKLAFFLALFLIDSLFAQNRPFEIGVSIMPLISNNLLTAKSSAMPEIVKLYQDNETNLFGFAMNAVVRKPITNKISMQSGFGFSLEGNDTKKRNVNWASPDPSLPNAIKLQYIHYNLNIPVLLNYHFSVFNSPFYVQTGLVGVYNFKRISKAISYFSSKSSVTTVSEDNLDIRRINLSTSLGLGMDIINKAGYKVFIQPNFDINLFSIHQEAPISRRLYNFGLIMGVLFR